MEIQMSQDMNSWYQKNKSAIDTTVRFLMIDPQYVLTQLYQKALVRQLSLAKETPARLRVAA